MSEIQIQAKSYQWLWNMHPKTRRCFFAVPNGGTRNMIEATQLKASGLTPGIPDCVLVWKGRVFGFEFKTETGTISPVQKLVHEAWRGQGVDVYVVRSFDQFQSIVSEIIAV
jgi:hypothetical protein